MNEESVKDFGLYFTGWEYRAVNAVNLMPWSEVQVPAYASVGRGELALWTQQERLGSFSASLPYVPPRLMEQSTEDVWYVEPDFSYVFGSGFGVDLEVEEYSRTTADNVVYKIEYNRGLDRIFAYRLTEEQPKSSDEISLKIVQKEAGVPPEFTVVAGLVRQAWYARVTGLTFVNADETLQDSPSGFKFDPDTIRQLGQSTVDGTLNQLLSDGLITEITNTTRIVLQGGQDVSQGFFSFGKVEFED